MPESAHAEDSSHLMAQDHQTAQTASQCKSQTINILDIPSPSLPLRRRGHGRKHLQGKSDYCARCACQNPNQVDNIDESTPCHTNVSPT